jgi:hypothetical protein
VIKQERERSFRQAIREMNDFRKFLPPFSGLDNSLLIDYSKDVPYFLPTKVRPSCRPCDKPVDPEIAEGKTGVHIVDPFYDGYLDELANADQQKFLEAFSEAYALYKEARTKDPLQLAVLTIFVSMFCSQSEASELSEQTLVFVEGYPSVVKYNVYYDLALAAFIRKDDILFHRMVNNGLALCESADSTQIPKLAADFYLLRAYLHSVNGDLEATQRELSRFASSVPGPNSCPGDDNQFIVAGYSACMNEFRIRGRECSVQVPNEYRFLNEENTWVSPSEHMIALKHKESKQTIMDQESSSSKQNP